MIVTTHPVSRLDFQQLQRLSKQLEECFNAFVENYHTYDEDKALFWNAVKEEGVEGEKRIYELRREQEKRREELIRLRKDLAHTENECRLYVHLDLQYEQREDVERNFDIEVIIKFIDTRHARCTCFHPGADCPRHHLYIDRLPRSMKPNL